MPPLSHVQSPQHSSALVSLSLHAQPLPRLRNSFLCAFSPFKRPLISVNGSHLSRIFKLIGEMSLKVATSICAVLGVFCALSCLIGGPMLFQEMSRIRSELDEEMMLFKVQSDEIWDTIMEVSRERRRVRQVAGEGSQQLGNKSTETEEKKDKGSEQSGTATSEGPDRIAAQSPMAKCNCAERKCPAGPKGPRGAPGDKGEPGAPGQDGVAGIAAEDVLAQVQQLDKCFHCPMGPPGPPGLPGRPGPRGMRGGKGQPGVPGRDGQPGFPGGLGPQGKAGSIGTVGEQGIPGEDTKLIHGKPGLKGLPGAVGEQGDAGPQGPQGGIGPQGPEGDKGEPGKDGKNGSDGDQGQAGDEGEPGEDAEYCPCPSRNSLLLSSPKREMEGKTNAANANRESQQKQKQSYRRKMMHKQ